MRIDVDFGNVLNQLSGMEGRAKRAMEQSLNDCVDDLVRVSSEITPLDKGILSRSHAKEVRVRGVKAEATVSYTVRERNRNGDFNYALWIHEGSYNLGPASQRRPGTTGMSGKHYDVGNKYLTRPLEGEQETYIRHMRDEIRRAID